MAGSVTFSTIMLQLSAAANFRVVAPADYGDECTAVTSSLSWSIRLFATLKGRSCPSSKLSDSSSTLRKVSWRSLSQAVGWTSSLQSFFRTMLSFCLTAHVRTPISDGLERLVEYSIHETVTFSRFYSIRVWETLVTKFNCVQSYCTPHHLF